MQQHSAGGCDVRMNEQISPLAKVPAALCHYCTAALMRVEILSVCQPCVIERDGTVMVGDLHSLVCVWAEW